MQEYPGQPAKQRNKPLIVCAIVGCSCLALFVLVILPAILFPVFSQARESAQAAACLSNEKQQALAVLMYTEDYDEKLPRAARWMEDLVPYTKNEMIFHCPSISPGNVTPDCGYAFDSRLSGQELADIESPATSAMIFESTDLKRSAADACKSLPQGDQLRHHSDNIAFMDGHAHAFRQLSIDDEIKSISKNPITPKPKKTGK